MQHVGHLSSARPLANELDQRIINFCGVRSTQKVNPAWYSHQISRLSVLEELNLLLGACD